MLRLFARLRRVAIAFAVRLGVGLGAARGATQERRLVMFLEAFSRRCLCGAASGGLSNRRRIVSGDNGWRCLSDRLRPALDGPLNDRGLRTLGYRLCVADDGLLDRGRLLHALVSWAAVAVPVVARARAIAVLAILPVMLRAIA